MVCPASPRTESGSRPKETFQGTNKREDCLSLAAGRSGGCMVEARRGTRPATLCHLAWLEPNGHRIASSVVQWICACLTWFLHYKKEASRVLFGPHT